MLDSISENVLKYIINLYNTYGKPVGVNRKLRLNTDDAEKMHFNIDMIAAVCIDLGKKGYLDNIFFSAEDVDLTLTYKGLSYFEYKKIAKKEYIKKFLVSKISDVIVSAIVADLTVLLNC